MQASYTAKQGKTLTHPGRSHQLRPIPCYEANIPIIQLVKNPNTPTHQRGQTQILFNEYSLHASLLGQQELIQAEIDNYDPNELLKGDINAVATYLDGKYLVETVAIDREGVWIEERPMTIEVRSSYYDSVQYAEGAETRFCFPIEGDPDLLNAASNTIFMNRPVAEGAVDGSNLVLSYRGHETPPIHLKQRLESDLENIEQRLSAVNSNILDWNKRMEALIRERLQTRRKRLGGLKSELGFPLRARSGPQQGYDRKSIVRRTIRPQVSDEPFLEMAHYDEILKVISRVSVAIERAPSAFSTMDEEALRHQLLVPLNVLYEDQAHAEAFNFRGKTDILIRVRGRAVFIAECKIWKGAKSLQDGITQLLGYTSWRDTKTALLVFNRGRRFSSVLAKILEAAEGHNAVVRRQPYDIETGARFVLRRPDDQAREFIMTVLAFEVPSQKVRRSSS